MLLSLEEQKYFKGCTKLGACYQCFKKSGEMSVLWKDCVRHNKLAKRKSKSDHHEDIKGNVKAKNVKIGCRDLSSLLSEASITVKDISEKEDLSCLYYHDIYDSTYKVKSALLVDSGAARTTLSTTTDLSNVQHVDNDIKLEFANGVKVLLLLMKVLYY